MSTGRPCNRLRLAATFCGLLAFIPAPALAQNEEPAERKISGKELTLLREGDSVHVKQGDRLLVRYRYDGVSHKPYVAEFTAPGGTNILRDAPADHLHHHGLMFAVKVNGINFWEEGAAGGSQTHVRWRSLRIASVRTEEKNETQELAILREHLMWQGKDGKALLEEDRVVSVPASRPGQPRLLTWQSTFTLPANAPAVTLTGTAYHGLGARFLKAMDTGGQFQNSTGGTQVAGTHSKKAAWCAYTAEPAPGKPVTVAMFDAPGNPRHPSRWFTMDKGFAYLSATLGLDTDPLKLEPGQRLTLQYGFAVFDGAVKKETIESAYGRWQKIPQEVRMGSTPGLIGRYFAAGQTQRPNVVRVDGNVAFDWSDGMPDDRLPPGPFTASWEGQLFVDTDGSYRFSTAAAGVAKVWVGDRLVGGPDAKETQPINLEYGFHPIRVEYQARGERPGIKLFWQCNDQPREVISQRYLVHTAGSEREVQTGLAHEKGRHVVERLACGRCHGVTGVDIDHKPGPPLNRLAEIGADYLRRWLRDPQSVRPGTTMPNLQNAQGRPLAEPDIDALVAFLRNLPPDAETTKRLAARNRYRQPSATNFPTGSHHGGRELFHKLGCIACHAPEDPASAEPDEAPTLADIGAKWSRGSILRFLEDPLAWHPDGRMPDFRLTEMEAADLSAYLTSFRKLGNGTECPDPDTQAASKASAAPSPELLARGKELVQQLRCAACHDIGGMETPKPTARSLDRYDGKLAAAGCVQDPGSSSRTGPSPHFGLSMDERSAMAEFLARRPEKPSRIAVQETAERSVLERYLCMHCHSRDGIQEEMLGKAVLRYLGDTTGHGPRAAAMTAPDLSGVGAKLRAEWLDRVVAGTAPTSRPWLTIRMPRFPMNALVRKSLVDRLVTADGEGAGAAPSPPPRKVKDPAAAATLLGSRGFGCINCHHLGKHRPTADTVGPDLAQVGQRISRDWFMRWLENPARVRPGTPMPAYLVSVKDVAGGDLGTQKDMLWNYLATTPPEAMILGTEPSRLVRVTGPQPAVVQGRVLGAAPLHAARSVAIGLPGGQSLLFDGGRLAWLGGWKGDFLKESGLHGARHHWIPAGQTVWTADDPTAPVLFCDRQSGEWVTPSSWRDRFGWLDEVRLDGRGVRLLYRLRAPGTTSGDEDEGPWITVTEWIEPNPPGDSQEGWTRRLEITGVPSRYDVLVPCPISNGQKPVVRGAEVAGHPAAHVVANGHSTIFRAAGMPGMRWIQAPGSITQPILQPFTDKPIQPGQRYEPVCKTGKTGLAIVIPNREGQKPLEVILQMAKGPAEGEIPDGPPRRWPASTEKPPRDSNKPPVSEPIQISKLSESSGLTVAGGYRVQRLPLPEDFLVCALTFWNGKLVAGGYDGEIRIAEDSDGDGLPDRYRHFAGTLDQVNNLRVFDNELYATHPGAVYRIRDRDSNGVADSYEIVSSAWDWSGHPFDWFFGLTRDKDGNLYGCTTTPHERGNVPGLYMRGSVLKIAPDGKTRVAGVGTRYNFGWAQNRAGRSYFNVNQGHWNITCGIHQVIDGSHYGFGERDASKVLPPVVRVPYPWCRSLTGMVFAEASPAFGPFQDQGFAADYNTRRVIRWTDEPAGKLRQGACYPFLDGLDAGPTEMAFGPDGALYVGFMSDASWYPERARGGIYRVTFTGPAPFAVRSGRVTRDGFAIDLTEAVDPASVQVAGCKVHRYFHEYRGNYHSEEIAHEDVSAHKAELSADRKTLLVTTAAHLTPRIYRLHLKDIRSARGQPLERGEIYFTVHATPVE